MEELICTTSFRIPPNLLLCKHADGASLLSSNAKQLPPGASPSSMAPAPSGSRLAPCVSSSGVFISARQWSSKPNPATRFRAHQLTPQFCFQRIQTAFQLCALNPNPPLLSLCDGVSGSWQGESAKMSDYYFRSGVPQYWAHFFPSALSSAATMYLMGAISPTISILGLRHTTVVKLAALALELVIHPLKVAQLHYSVLPERQGGFTSTVSALQRLWARNPGLLWTGLPAVILCEVLQVLFCGELLPAFFQKCVPARWPSYFISMLRTLLPTFIASPLKVLSVQSMSQTPLLLEHPRFTAYGPNLPSHIAKVWNRDGLRGFFRGLPLAFAHSVAVSSTRLTLYGQSIDWLKPMSPSSKLTASSAAVLSAFLLSSVSLIHGLRAGPTPRPAAWHV